MVVVVGWPHRVASVFFVSRRWTASSPAEVSTSGLRLPRHGDGTRCSYQWGGVGGCGEWGWGATRPSLT